MAHEEFPLYTGSFLTGFGFNVYANKVETFQSFYVQSNERHEPETV